MTKQQINKLRLLNAEHKYAAGIYHECLKRKAPAAERHAAEAACTAAWQAKVDFSKSL